MAMSRAARKLFTQIQERINRGQRALEEGAKDLAYDIATGAPVDTGSLRNSVSVEKNGKDIVVIVGGSSNPHDVDYAEYVENGTSKMRAQPFIGPALDRAEKRIREKVAVEIHK